MVSYVKARLKRVSETICVERRPLPERFGKVFSDVEYKILEDSVKQIHQLGKLSAENLENLKAIQMIFLIEEGEILTIDGVLSRILKFYRSYIPYN